jgi:hypothetical protein
MTNKLQFRRIHEIKSDMNGSRFETKKYFNNA